MTLLGHVTDVTHEHDEQLRREGEARLARHLAEVGAALLAGGAPQESFPLLAAAAADVAGAQNASVVLATPGSQTPLREAGFGPLADLQQERRATFSDQLWAAAHGGGATVTFAAPPAGSDPGWASLFGSIAAAPSGPVPVRAGCWPWPVTRGGAASLQLDADLLTRVERRWG